MLVFHRYPMEDAIATHYRTAAVALTADCECLSFSMLILHGPDHRTMRVFGESSLGASVRVFPRQ